MSALFTESLRNRHVLVIGGTRGIGKAFSTLAVASGAHVSIISRTAPASQTVAGKHFSADVTDHDQMSAAIARAVAEHGKLHGVAFFQRHRGKENSWAGNLAVTLTATRDVIVQARDHFAPSEDTSIVMLASSAANFVADEQDDAYHSAKTGLLGLMRYFAFKLGPQGIRVNAVSPGTLIKEESKAYFQENKALQDTFRRITPLRRMGTAEEVARVVAFLLSPASSFITGQELRVDGGVSLHAHESMARAWLENPLAQDARPAS